MAKAKLEIAEKEVFLLARDGGVWRVEMGPVAKSDEAGLKAMRDRYDDIVKFGLREKAVVVEHVYG